MGSDGHAYAAGGPLILGEVPIVTTASTFYDGLTADAAGWELDAITRPKVWRHGDTWSWMPWIGHWFRRLTISVGPICIDVCRCRCQECREYVADLLKRAGDVR
jgi:hypothetical protein